MSFPVYKYSRIPTGYKLIAMLLFGTAVATSLNPAMLLVSLAIVLGLYGIAGFGWKIIWTQLRPTIPFLVLIFAAQCLHLGIMSGLVVMVRVIALVLFAALVSLTTRTTEMIETITRISRPLAYLGISPSRIGLVFSLAMRFIPVIGNLSAQVREAQKARGLERSLYANIMPLLIRSLKMAKEVGEAIDARSFAIDDTKPIWSKRSPRNSNPMP